MPTVLAASICESYPYLVQTGLIDFLLPKKETMQIAKWYADAGSLHLSHLEPIRKAWHSPWPSHIKL